MEDYKNILCSDSVYEKYKAIIPNSTKSMSDVVNELRVFYNIEEDDSLSGKKILEYYAENGKVYKVTPKIPQGLIDDPCVLMYVNAKNGIVQGNGNSQKLAEKISAEILLLRGLTEEEHEHRELVYNYVDVLKNYFT